MFKKAKLIAVTLSAIFISTVLMGAATFRNYIRIFDGDQRPRSVMTQATEPEDILKDAGIVLGKYDTYELVNQSQWMYMLKIDRAFDVSFDNGGFKTTVPMQEKETVADLLKKAEVTLNEQDIIMPGLEEEVTPETQVVLQRVTFETVKVSEPVPFETVERHTPLLADGVKRTLKDGADGFQQRTTVSKYVNGKYQEMVSEEIVPTTKPVDQVVLVGDSKAVVSTLEVPEDLELDENGKPVKYSRVVTGKGTAYSAWEGALTASGRYAIPGHVAVNPNVIPYGSRLYIRSADGKFVYGYAIAADTGIALMDGRVTVDLFYDSYLESCLFGAKTMEIYVLD